MDWRLSVRPSVCLSCLYLTLAGRAAHTQHDSPEGTTRRCQLTFPCEYYEDGHVCLHNNFLNLSKEASPEYVAVCFDQSVVVLSCDVLQGDQVDKSVFIIFFQGDQLRSRVKKICEGSVYELVTISTGCVSCRR